MNNFFFAVFIFLQENVGIINSPSQTAVEPTIIQLVLWLKLLVETIGAIIIAIGVISAVFEFGRRLSSAKTEGYTKIRLLLARYLALALEFQLGADILSTAISPTWDQILKLGAIAVIRTALNYFLSHEMEQERKLTSAETEIDENNAGKKG
ncbi:hypothetical protein BH24ACI2_BH24ACI2_11020 [soil metagenome]|nr:DUF1622 domain-containing protein [Acidobacteriota bacterium]